jgi:DNA repair protein RecO (recombination protein O)
VSVRDEPTFAFVLRSVDYGETDRVFTLLTQRFGKLGCLARGARRSKKRFGGVMQPFTLLRVSIEPRRTGLALLNSAEIARHPLRITGSLDRVSAGYAAVELLRELSAELEPDAAIFELAIEVIEALDELELRASAHALVAMFEARLLALCGFAPLLDACGHCGKQATTGQAARFDATQGHLVCRDCGFAPFALSGAARAALALASSGAFQLAAEGLAPADRAAAQHAMRALTEQRIGRALPLPALEDPRA